MVHASPPEAFPRDLKELLAHMGWADASVWRAALDLPAWSTDDERIGKLLHHLHTVQWVYLKVWRGEVAESPAIEEFPDLSAIACWAKRYHAALPLLLSRLQPGELDRKLEVPWARRLAERFGTVHATTLGQSMLQVASHSTYHRGQINARIRELGGEPPLVDYIVWLWRGQPDASWPKQIR